MNRFDGQRQLAALWARGVSLTLQDSLASHGFRFEEFPSARVFAPPGSLFLLAWSDAVFSGVTRVLLRSLSALPGPRDSATGPYVFLLRRSLLLSPSLFGAQPWSLLLVVSLVWWGNRLRCRRPRQLCQWSGEISNPVAAKGWAPVLAVMGDCFHNTASGQLLTFTLPFVVIVVVVIVVVVVAAEWQHANPSDYPSVCGKYSPC